MALQLPEVVLGVGVVTLLGVLTVAFARLSKGAALGVVGEDSRSQTREGYLVHPALIRSTVGDLGVYLGAGLLALAALVTRHGLASTSALAGQAALYEVMLPGFDYSSNTIVGVMTVMRCGLGAVVLLLGLPSMTLVGMQTMEYAIVVLLSVLGLRLVLASGDMLTMYRGLELSTLARYIMAAHRHGSHHSSEAGLKYFILGSVASAMLLMGVALVYGATGSIVYSEVAMMLSGFEHVPASVYFGVPMLVGAFLFKRGAAPLHWWLPDVYQGAPTPATRFFAVVPKAPMLVALMHLCYGAFWPLLQLWQPLLGGAAVVSMYVGAIGALSQVRLQRFLAFSSVGHVGYLLMGLSLFSLRGLQGVIFYIIVYSLTSLVIWAVVANVFVRAENPQGGFAGEGDMVSPGTREVIWRNLLRSSSASGLPLPAFGVACVGSRNRQVQLLSEWSLLSAYNPALAVIVVVVMLSMAGVPPFPGFAAKALVFLEAMSAYEFVLAVAALGAATVGAFYYLRVTKVLYFEPMTTSVLRPWYSERAVSVWAAYVIAGGTLVLLYVGLWPYPLMALSLEGALDCGLHIHSAVDGLHYWWMNWYV